MHVNLEPHQEQAIQAAIKAGRFRSLEEFIESAVRTLAPRADTVPASASDAPAMIQVDGLWVHRGQPEAGAPWDRVVDDVREERLNAILKASYP